MSHYCAADKLRKIGGFRDRELERAFRARTLALSAPYLKAAIPALGVAFAFFLVLDWKILAGDPRFAQALFCRLSFLLLTIVVALLLRSPKSEKRREFSIIAVCVGGLADYGWTFFIYADADPLVQSMSVMVMIAALFLLPLRLRHALLFSVLFAATGLISVFTKGSSSKATGALSFAVYFSLMVLISAIAAWRTDRARRHEFLRAEELKELARIDALTGVLNRRAGEEKLQATLDEVERYGGEASLILFDIDFFKHVNDTFGHAAGDRVLKEICAGAVRALRHSDSVSRWGGEEFIVVLPRSCLSAATALAERLRTAFSERPIEGVGTVTASFGVTEIRKGDGAEAVFSRADRALYQAKMSGRNTVCAG